MQVSERGPRLTRSLKHRDLWAMHRIEAPVLRPDGAALAFVLRSPKASGQTYDVWLIDLATESSPKCLLSGAEPKSALCWSPDGCQLALAMQPDKEEHAQIHAVRASDGSLRRLTSMPRGANFPKWRPDGRALLFESVQAQRTDRRTSTVRIYDTAPVRFWNRWLEEGRPHPFVIELDSAGPPRDLLEGSEIAESKGFRGIILTPPAATIETLQAQWNADGSAIVFAAFYNAHALVREKLSSAIFLLSVEGGEPQRLTPTERSFSDPLVCADGHSLYALEKHWPDGYTRTDLVRLSLNGSAAPICLTSAWDRSVSSYVVSENDATFYLNVEDNGTNRIFSLPVGGGAARQVTNEEAGAWRAFGSRPGKVLALHETSSRAAEIVEINVENRSQARLTSFNEDISLRIDISSPLQFSFMSSRGTRIHNLLFLPPRFNPQRKYPLVTCIHGGPHVMAADTFLENWLSPPLLARPGYVVLCTNYSGSTGFGRAFAESVEGDVLRLPAAELLEAARAALTQFEFVDGTRQAVVGGSYGGYLVNWLNGQTRHFKCAIVHAGAINNLSQYGSSDCGWDREIRMKGPVWEAGGQWMEQNPLRYAGNFATPALILHGERDFRVPLTESLTTFKMMARLDVESRLVVFPDEGHFIAKQSNSRVFWREIWRWLRRYL